MGAIHRLDDAVVQRIAAGEVIQRPGSAIKELLENSLDARATNITITIQEGGYKSFSVQDNGEGIAREDLPLLCERYATSKLQTLEDLKTIGTFGFRGEALASISHVSRLTVTSKTADAPLGYRLAYRDGRMVGEAEPMAANRGTLIMVQDLFYNNAVRREVTPAQKNEEYLRTVEVVQKYAIERAGRCAFSCGRGPGGALNKTAGLVTRLEQSSLDVIRLVYGEAVASSLLAVAVEDGGRFSLRGLISNAYHQQKSFTFILFINGRLVESGRLRRAMGHVYGDILLRGSYPFVYLSLQLAPGTVDVNIHPTKREVIFLEEDLVVEAIVDRVKGLLGEAGVVKVFTPPRPGAGGMAADVRASLASIQATKSRPMPGADYLAASRPPRYPFQQIHADSQTRSLDYFLYNKRPRHTVTVGGEEQMVAVEGEVEARGESRETNANPFVVGELEGAGIDRALPDRPDESWGRRIRHAKRKIYEGLIREASSAVREIMRQHAFVGTLSERQVFIQVGTTLVLVDIPRVMVEWLFNAFIDDGRRVAVSMALSQPWPVVQCLGLFLAQNPELLALDSLVSDEHKLIEEIVAFIERQRDFLHQCVGLRVQNGYVEQLCEPFELFTSDQRGRLMEGLGGFLFRLAMDLDWEGLVAAEETVRQLVEDVCQGYAAMLTAAFVDSVEALAVNVGMNVLYQHDVMERLKRDPASALLPGELTRNGAIIKVATTHDLYKIFERC